jgi:hypothetical protein
MTEPGARFAFGDVRLLRALKDSHCGYVQDGFGFQIVGARMDSAIFFLNMSKLLTKGRFAVLFGLFSITIFLFLLADQTSFSNSSTSGEEQFAPPLLSFQNNESTIVASALVRKQQQQAKQQTNQWEDVSAKIVRNKKSSQINNYKAQKPLNVMILYPDDLRHDSIGVAKTQPVLTPFLDSLANNDGIRFTHNCVTTSVCWISRA